MHTFASLSGAIIAVAFWAFLAVSAATGMKYDFRKRQLAMESLRAAIEHGQPLEPAVVEKLLARHGDSEAGRAQELQPHLPSAASSRRLFADTREALPAEDFLWAWPPA
jgi:hypothetical protein